MATVDDRFDQLAGRLDPPVAIVTTAIDDDRAGCVVGFHSQCGIDPPRYAVWISKANRTYRLGVFAERFAVHFLSPEDRDLGEMFASHSGDDVDKFAACAWTNGPGGVPLLDAIAHRFVGRRVALLDAGPDHVCVVLAPESVDSGSDNAPDWLRVADLDDVTPGHDASERHPPD